MKPWHACHYPSISQKIPTIATLTPQRESIKCLTSLFQKNPPTILSRKGIKNMTTSFGNRLWEICHRLIQCTQSMRRKTTICFSLMGTVNLLNKVLKSSISRIYLSLIARNRIDFYPTPRSISFTQQPLCLWWKKLKLTQLQRVIDKLKERNNRIWKNLLFPHEIRPSETKKSLWNQGPPPSKQESIFRRKLPLQNSWMLKRSVL